MEYPFIVKIYKYDTSEYGDLLWSNLKGVIIDKSLIITSASLLQKSTDVTVHVGSNTFKVEKIIIHESYSKGKQNSENDIALLKLVNPIPISLYGLKEAEILDQLDFDTGLIVDIIGFYSSFKATIVKCDTVDIMLSDRSGCITEKMFSDRDSKANGKLVVLNGKVLGHTITNMRTVYSNNVTESFVRYGSYTEWACEITNTNSSVCNAHSYKKDIATVQNSLKKRLDNLEQEQEKLKKGVNTFGSNLQDNLNLAKKYYDDLISKGNERIYMLETKERALIDKAGVFASQINEMSTFSKNKIISVEKFMYDLKSDVTKLASQCNINENKINYLETQVKYLENQMGDNSKQLNSYKVKVDKLQFEIDRLTQQIEGNNGTNSQVTILQEMVVNLTSTITFVTKKIDSSDTSATSKFEELEDKKTTLKAIIEKMEKRFEKCSCVEKQLFDHILFMASGSVEPN
ncbi:uncharacterized protein LOC143196960 isoform X2 [Rhynchophorus ferrugineus]